MDGLQLIFTMAVKKTSKQKETSGADALGGQAQIMYQVRKAPRSFQVDYVFPRRTRNGCLKTQASLNASFLRITTIFRFLKSCELQAVWRAKHAPFRQMSRHAPREISTHFVIDRGHHGLYRLGRQAHNIVSAPCSFQRQREQETVPQTVT
jgi:hypothetical protein